MFLTLRYRLARLNVSVLVQREADEGHDGRYRQLSVQF